MERYGKKEKLPPMFVGPVSYSSTYKSAYRLELSENLSVILPVFHISMLGKHVKDDGNQIVPDVTSVKVRAYISIDEELVSILDKREMRLSNKSISMVKVQWSSLDKSDATWKRNEDVLWDFFHLF